jgi:hypothetical protein
VVDDPSRVADLRHALCVLPAMRSPRFWPALANALDVHGPAYAALRGAPRPGAA